jgi:hypothetical protein
MSRGKLSHYLYSNWSLFSYRRDGQQRERPCGTPAAQYGFASYVDSLFAKVVKMQQRCKRTAHIRSDEIELISFTWLR